MSDFTEARDQLLQARDEKEQARRSLLEARERLRKIAAEEAELNRVFDRRNEEHMARRARLVRTRGEIEATLTKSRTDLGRQAELELGRFRDFGVFTDPRVQIQNFRDSFPILLMPLRLETRFKTVTLDNRPRQQLWVRIYPDECAVDTFEATLSELEVKSAQSYWGEIWRAGRVEEGEPGAWRALVASHGSGRAAWIVQHYQPINLAERPKKTAATDVILVIKTDTPPSNAEVPVLIAFWRDVWLADGNKTQEDAARATLETAVGPARAAEIVKNYKPINMEDKPAAPLTKADVRVDVALVVFPLDAGPTKTQAWSQAPVVNVLPDRFVLTGYSGNAVAFEEIGNPVPSPLVVGPDPSASPEEQLRQQDGELVMPEEIRWMVDFERAVQIGLGFKINLTNTQAEQGFDRIVALGIRLSADETAGQQLLEELFEHHQNGRSGLSLLSQGTPTNNTESDSSGYTRSADADASFADIFGSAAGAADLFVAPNEWNRKKDGQWLAEYLGINHELLRKSRHSDGLDQTEARAMNVVLWPATFGYMMETMLLPVFSEQAIEQTRWFFNNFVSGRGAVPAIRIGSQPYGILPTTAFSRMNWLNADRSSRVAGLEHPDGHEAFLRQLSSILGKMDQDWAQMSQRVSFAGKPPDANNDAHKILLDVIGLHSGSVEYYQRYAESLDHIFNLLNLGGFGGALIAALIAAGYVLSGLQLLRKLGYTGDATPDILNKFFLTSQHLLKGPIVDDRPLSETEKIRKYTDEADENNRRNYIKWLIDASRSSLETIRQERGFKENKPPTALLYLMLRHALILGYWDTSMRLHRAAGIELPSGILREPSFIHVAEQAAASESRWSFLYRQEPRITNNRSLLIADFIPQVLRTPVGRYLNEQISALEQLKDVPTARLERLFAEHIDCCSYRLDAWRLGLVNYQLAAMRYGFSDNEIIARQGVYLGAYGWLEKVKSENKVLTPQPLDPPLSEVFNKPGDAPLMRDNTNGGYIHAPSLNQAVTAAVLRNGYLANATPANPQSLAVNLSSERVRRALSILEGIRGGQSLGALLGYQFERGLHDRHNQAEVDQFIFRIRKAFPLRANRIQTTRTEDENVSIEAIEARNVMDGVSLVEQIKKSGRRTFPFGVDALDKDPRPTPEQAGAINAEVERLLDTHDAVADLALAEGVHQAVQGNYDRVSSALETYSKATFPPEPDVVQTPRSGTTLTHRIGLQLEAELAAGPGTPRSKAEPALNKWLGSVLPALSSVFCQVEYFDPIAAAPRTRDVSLQDLQLQPLDVLYLLRADNQQSMSELDDRVLQFVTNTFTPRPDAELRIKYLGKPAGGISIFELMPLIANLRSMLLRSRALRPSDISLQTESAQQQDETVFVDDTRITAVRTTLDALHTNLAAFSAAAPTIDAGINGIVALLDEAATYGIPQTGWGWAYEWKRQAFNSVLTKVDELVDRWDARLVEYDGLIVDYTNLPAGATDEEKFALLQRAEALISTQPEFPLPATPDDLKTALDGKRNAFNTRLGLFKTNVLQANTQSLTTLVNNAKALLPVTIFDLRSVELTEVDDKIVAFAAELNQRAQAAAKAADDRLRESQSLLTAHGTAARASERARLMETAARTLLGEDFLLIPEFTVAAAQGDEWEKAFGARSDLLKYQTDTLQVDFPVDDWLYGVARVREKLSQWERSLMLIRAFAKPEPELVPIQLPFKPNDRWLGLEFPQNDVVDPTKPFKFDGDRLLYTAHYSLPFQKTRRQCGLLLDEWTEVIPAEEETTGIAFHYDRPNSEPPQVMLLVTPSEFKGSWQWRDLVDAVNETLELAKKRAVEPVHVDAENYARFLPATVMAVTVSQISIAANLAVNNRVSEFMVRQDNG